MAFNLPPAPSSAAPDNAPVVSLLRPSAVEGFRPVPRGALDQARLRDALRPGGPASTRSDVLLPRACGLKGECELSFRASRLLVKLEVLAECHVLVLV